MKEENEYLAEFLFYCCPECNNRNISRDLFLEHAFEKHPEAKDNIERLKNKVETMEEELANIEESLNEEPWCVRKLEAYLFFCCPEAECGEIDQDEASFIKHAFGAHPYANDLHWKFLEMMRIKDDSTEDDHKQSTPKPRGRRPGKSKSKTNSQLPPTKRPENLLPLPDNLAIKQEVVDVDDYYSENNGTLDCFEQSFSEGDYAIKQEFDDGDQAMEYLPYPKVEYDESYEPGDNDYAGGSDDDDIDFDPETKDDIQYKCGSCQDMFDDFSELTNHMKEVHNEDDVGSIETKIVNKKTAPKVKKQLKPCDFCGKEFKTNGFLRKHIIAAHDGMGLEAVPTSLDCPTCGKSFKEAQLVKNHIKRVHENTNEFRCNICQKVFDDSYKLKKHIKIVHEKVKKWQCHICAKAFGTSSDMKRHVKKVHDKIKDFKCELCSDAFADRTSLKNHERNKHEKFEEFDFKCDLCNKVFKTEDGVKIHMKLVHEGKKNEESEFSNIATFDGQVHRCELCNKEFSAQASLRYHIVTVHEKRKDHQCHLCERAFAKPTLLKHHIDFIHYGKKDFQCDQCEKSFPRPDQLKGHIKSFHEGKRDCVCNICGKGFTTMQSMNNHVKTVHEKRRDFMCHICSKPFSTKETVKAHIRKIHDTGLDLIQKDKDFKCELCNTMFTKIGTLNRHMKKFHSDNQESIRPFHFPKLPLI